MEDRLKVKELAEKFLASEREFPFGICSYDSVQPLIECRAAQRFPQNAASVLVCLFPYYTGEADGRNISRYAQVTDYHLTAGEYLGRFCTALREAFPQNRFEPFTDNSPIREVSAAFNAGLGRLGKNGLIINPEYGSYVFIGEVVTDLELQSDMPLEPACCIGCGRCLDSCPNGALADNGSVNLNLCRSHITQKKGELTEWETEQIKSGGLIWGCDICNDVCPMNKGKKLTPIREFIDSAEAVFDSEKAEALFKTRAFNYRGKKTIVRNINILEEKTQDGR